MKLSIVAPPKTDKETKRLDRHKKTNLVLLLPPSFLLFGIDIFYKLWIIIYRLTVCTVVVFLFTVRYCPIYLICPKIGAIPQEFVFDDKIKERKNDEIDISSTNQCVYGYVTGFVLNNDNDSTTM